MVSVVRLRTLPTGVSSIEYEIVGLGDRPGSAGVAEVSGPASAPVKEKQATFNPSARRRLLLRQVAAGAPGALRQAGQHFNSEVFVS